MRHYSEVQCDSIAVAGILYSATCAMNVQFDLCGAGAGPTRTSGGCGQAIGGCGERLFAHARGSSATPAVYST